MQFKTDHKRVFGLDIFRAVAIILVVLVHGAYILNDTILEGFPYFSMIDGVDLFFVLSGFLIGGILLKEINKEATFRHRQLFRFWKRRWFRTLPNYYLILLLNYLVVKHGVINEDITQFNYTFIVFLQNFSTPFHGFFWESWSLSIEEWFYIFTPLLILLSIRFFSAKTSFLVSTLIMILFPALYRLNIYDASIDPYFWDVIFRKTVLTRLDSIGYGLLAAWTHYYYIRIWKKYRIAAFISGTLFMLFVIHFNPGHQSIYSQVLYFSFVPISAGLLLPLAESIRNANGFFAWSIEHISKISYSMYLINLALVAEVMRDNFTPRGGTDGIIKYVLYWIIVIGVSTILYKYYEKPMMDLRDRKISFRSLTSYIKKR